MTEGQSGAKMITSRQTGKEQKKKAPGTRLPTKSNPCDLLHQIEIYLPNSHQMLSNYESTDEGKALVIQKFPKSLSASNKI